MLNPGSQTTFGVVRPKPPLQQRPASPELQRDEWVQERVLRCLGPNFVADGAPVKLEAPAGTHLHIVWARFGSKAAPLDCTAAARRLVSGAVFDTRDCQDMAQALKMPDAVGAGDVQFVCAYRAEVRFADDTDSTWGRLSTMSASTFIAAVPGSDAGQQQWQSVEHFFQACKFDDPDVREEIRDLDTAEEAREYGCDGGRYSALRKDWEARMDEAMYAGLRGKFLGCERSRHVLLQTKGLRIVYTGSDPHWGTGADGEGLNRLGGMLLEVYRELTLPEIVPRELFFGQSELDFAAPTFSTDDFVTRLTHRVLSMHRGKSARVACEAFEELFRCSAELLEMHENRAHQSIRVCTSHMHDSGTDFLSTYLRAARSLESADRNLGRLEERLGQLRQASVDIGETLSVTDLQIQRAANARQVIEHFDAFCALPSDDMAGMVKALEELRGRQRRREAEQRQIDFTRSLRKNSFGEVDLRAEEDSDAGSDDGDEHAFGDEPDADEDEAEASIREKLRSPALHNIPEEYKSAPGSRAFPLCVSSVVRLKGLVRDWGPGREGAHLSKEVELGKQNVLDFDSYLARALVRDFETLQNGMVDALGPYAVALPETLASGQAGSGGLRSHALRSLDRMFLRPMRQVAALLSTLGHGHRSTETYVATVFVRLRESIRRDNPDLEMESSFASRSLANSGGPIARLGMAEVTKTEKHLAPDAEASQCIRREAFAAQRVFHPHHQGVLKSILQRFVIAEPGIGLQQLVARELRAVSRRMRSARLVQNRLHGKGEQDLAAFREELYAKESHSGPSLMMLEFMEPCEGLTLLEVNGHIRGAIESWLERLMALHNCCSEWRRRVQPLLPEYGESVRLLLDEVFAPSVREYQNCVTGDDIHTGHQGAESWLLEACLASMPLPSGDDHHCLDVSEAISVMRRVLARAEGLCAHSSKRFYDAQVMDIGIRLQCGLLRRFGKVISAGTAALRDASKKQDAHDAHRTLLQAVCWAVTGREMLTSALKDRVVPLLSPALRTKLSADRKVYQRELEARLGDAVGAVCAAVAVKALRILHAQQVKTDFHPSARKAAEVQGSADFPTHACVEFCSFLATEIGELRNALIPLDHAASLTSAFECLSSSLSKGVYAHVKAQTVKAEGAMQLKRDATAMLDCLRALGPQAAKPFERLKAVVDIFFVPGEALPTVLEQLRADRLSGMSRDDLSDFLCMREDKKEIRRDIDAALKAWDAVSPVR